MGDLISVNHICDCAGLVGALGMNPEELGRKHEFLSLLYVLFGSLVPSMHSVIPWRDRPWTRSQTRGTSLQADTRRRQVATSCKGYEGP